MQEDTSRRVGTRELSKSTWNTARSCGTITKSDCGRPGSNDSAGKFEAWVNEMLLASYRSPKTEVRPSAIGGRGLFAAAPIRRSEIVCVKGGHLLDRTAMAEHKATVG